MGFAIGQQVRIRTRPAEVGEILEVVEIGGASDSWYKVRFANGIRSVAGSSLVEVGIPREPEEQFASGVSAGMSDLRLLLTFLRLKERNLTDQLRSLRAARLQHLPYQYKPLLKFLESEHQRVLVADEVGLGKTIEAGLVLLELMARQEVTRVLIVVPSNLITKWQMELRDRFELEVEHRENKWLREVLLNTAEQGVELSPFRAICSIEAVRLLHAEFEQVKPPIDLVIVDEAHRLRNDTSLSHKLGRTLGECAEGMLLCSATPMQTASTDLHNLLRVMLGEAAGSFRDFQSDLEANRAVVLASSALARNEAMSTVAQLLRDSREAFRRARPADLPLLEACIASVERTSDSDRSGRVELLALISRLNWFGGVMTRTRKRMVMKNVAPRVAVAWPVRFTPEEREVYASITRETAERVGASGRWNSSTFGAIMRQRQAASCLAAFRNGVLSRDADARDALGGELQHDSDEAAETAAPKAAPRLPSDSKLDGFLDLLRELQLRDPRFKVVVFATFRATIHYLEQKVREQGWRCEVLTGEVTDRLERSARVQRVRDDPTCQLLLATEVGCEGIDLQFAGNLVNYDLPWNPMTVEQRIGRLDRIGQKAAQIRIFNLVVEGTIEERILKRLYERLRLFEESIGALEVIIGERVQKLALDLVTLSPEEQNRRLEQEALALENMQRESVRLDAEAANLVGDDAYYNQRLGEIEAKQGDIAKDLQVFVADFLGREFRHATLIEEDPSTSPGIYRLTFDSELLGFVGGRRELFGPGATFVGRYAESRERGGILVTFQQHVADARRDVEFLTTTHGFIRAIARRLEDQQMNFVRVFSVRASRPNVPPGVYFVAVALHRISGIRPRNELVAGAAQVGDDAPVTDDIADRLVADILRDGRSGAATAAALGSASLRAAADRAVLVRCERMKREVEAESEVFVSRRIDSLRRWFSARIDKARAQAETNRDVRVRRMAAGRAAKLEARLDEQIRRADEGRKVESESTTEAYVVVEVTN